MRRVIIDEATKGIRLGYRQENLYDTVEYRYPPDWIGGQILAYMLRPNDATSYPLANATRDAAAGTVTVTLTSTDLHHSGIGAIEYKYVLDNVVAKSKIFPASIASDIISEDGDPPDGYDDWMETMEALGVQTMNNARDAQEAADSARISASGASASAESASRDASSASRDASTASSAAQNASESASSASRDALSASESATSASSSASSAGRDATAASGSASNASESAATASAKADAAAASAAQAATSVANSGIIEMNIDSNDHLIYTRTEVVAIDFDLNSSGHLVVKEAL